MVNCWKNVNCLKYVHEKAINHSFEDMINAAACCGHLEGLQYVLNRYSPNVAIMSTACNYATVNGHLCCLKFLHAKGGLLEKYTSYLAARHGQLECLIYLHNNKCPRNTYTCQEAVIHGHLDCLQYLHETGCKLSAWSN